MKRVLITGANGYIGRALSNALALRLEQGEFESLALVDLALDGLPTGAGVRHLAGDLGQPALLEAATADHPDCVFHLAGITSRMAQEQFALGLQVNVTTTMALFERLRLQQHCPTVLCASTIGVYGTPLPSLIDDDTPPAPTLSYGAQKNMMEILLADYSRRGWLDGRTVRLPSVVARKGQANVALSSFASDLIREPAEGRDYHCPLGPDGQVWLLSLPACIEHLQQAVVVAAGDLPDTRVWNLPALRVSVADVVEALGRRFGADAARRVVYAPHPHMQAQFGQWPPLHTRIAERLHMSHDGDIDTLIGRALAP